MSKVTGLDLRKIQISLCSDYNAVMMHRHQVNNPDVQNFLALIRDCCIETKRKLSDLNSFEFLCEDMINILKSVFEIINDILRHVDDVVEVSKDAVTRPVTPEFENQSVNFN